MPRPKEGEENEKDRERWYELIHRAAPGTDWRTIEQQNLLSNIRIRKLRLASSLPGGPSLLESFANGQVQGTWSERGSDNQAGNVKAVDYVPATNTLYLVSDGGTLWKKSLGSGGWLPLNKDIRCKQDILRVITKPSGGNRILVASNNQIQFSDNDGKDFTASTGISFPVEWGGNYIASLTVLNDAAHTMYCLTRPWDPAPWDVRYWLYISTDLGQTFTRIYTFGFGDDNMLSLNNPYNSNEVYAADTRTNAGRITFFRISGSTVSQLSAVSGPSNVKCFLKGTRINGSNIFYLLLNSNQLYKSTNQGTYWTLQSTLPENSWDRLAVGINDGAKVFFGGVNAYRSTNSGVNWTKVNDWSEYYGAVSTKLHADIMEIASFRRTDGTAFTITNTHGGSYISNDDLASNTNLSVSSLRTSQYYDVLTDPDQPMNLFAGSQDQGFQRDTTATASGVLNLQQVISGDYGYLALSGAPKHLWTQYPGGNIYYYDNPKGGLSLTWKIPGTQLPNYSWMLPITNTASKTANEVLMAGGNVTGGDGSYLVRLTAATAAPFTITASQFNYDFRAHSNNLASGITAIEVSKTNSSRIYVATEDGTFFYTSDGGSSWAKSPSFTGPNPWYLYGSSIVSSKVTPNLVWFAGSGYAGTPVFKSTDGGQSFTAMSTGLPPTLVYKLVEHPSGTMLFAATEAGPYVYLASTNQWYVLTGAENPLQAYTSVQYIAATSTVRFGTYGRGIWDFKLNTAPAITTFLPTGGPTGAGVAIKGSKFDNVTAVRFNGIGATNIYRASSTLLYATVPSGATTGKIQVETQGGSASSSTFFTVGAVTSKWASKTGLTTGRILHGTVATGGKIYVFGGRSSSATLSSLEIYNPATNTWSAGASLPVATSGMATALGSNGLIYKFGGVTTGLVNTVYKYTPSTNSWASLASMPAAISAAAAAATSNGKIYVFGGETSLATSSSTNATRIYDIATNTWSSGVAMPVALQQHSAVTGVDGKIYIFGGRSTASGAPSSRVLIYNPATNAWTSGASMPIPKVQFGAARAADGRIYVVGGKAADPNSTGPFFHTVEIYNPATNTWATGPVIPIPNGQQTAVRLNDNLYALGGTGTTIRNYNIQLTVAPVAPTSLTAATVSASQINLKWTDKSLNESGFTIERATASAGPFTSVTSVSSNVTTYSNTGLAAGTTYYYRVKATNSAGSSAYSNVASATTQVATLTNVLTTVDNKSITEQAAENTLTVQPNPARDNTHIMFTVLENQMVRLEIYDVSGRIVARLYSGAAAAGRKYQFKWQVNGQAAGVYYSRLTTKKGVLTQSIVVLR